MKRRPAQTLEDWCEDFAQKAALDVYKLFEAERETVGDVNSIYIQSTFLAGFISALVYRALAAIPPSIKTEEKKYRYAKAKFEESKMAIQDAVAAGFSGAMKTWTGKSVDYFCQVKLMPEPTNKDTPC